MPQGEATTSQTWVHLNGRLIPEASAHISIYDHGFLYGDGAFEGIRVYSGNVFRLHQHLARLQRSVTALGFDLGVDRACVEAAIVDTVRTNGLSSGYIRVTVSRGVGLGLDPTHIDAQPTIVVSTDPRMRLYPPEMYDRGLEVVTASTRVPPSVCIDPQVKSLGRYVNNIAAKLEANRVGAGEALMLNMHGNVAEATGDNIFIVQDGSLATPPTSDGALPGITRGAIMDLAKETGIPCRESSLTLYDVYNAEEAFLTGTAAEVVGLVKCDGRVIGAGAPGPITQRLTAAFHELSLHDGVTV